MATAFQKLVWEKLGEIPSGKVTTYSEIARAIGHPGASRAVGSACGANECLIVIPCHRVVASTGHVGSYRMGQAQKISLLKQEGIQIAGERVVNFNHVLHQW